MRLNVGAFYYNYANLQVIQFVGISQSIVNGAKAELYGVDVDFNARITREFSINGGFEVVHANFMQYQNAVGSIPRPTGGAQLINVDASGNRIPQAQEFVGTLAADYQKTLSFGTINLNVLGNYNGDYFIEPDNFLRQKSYLTLNSSVRWTSPDETYSVSVFGRNLLDERVISQATSQAIGYPISYGQPPRKFGIIGTVSF